MTICDYCVKEVCVEDIEIKRICNNCADHTENPRYAMKTIRRLDLVCDKCHILSEYIRGIKLCQECIKKFPN